MLLLDTDISDSCSASSSLYRKAGIVPDVAFSSLQKRAIRTLWHVLEETDLMWIPTTKAWQLNERHYGALQVGCMSCATAFPTVCLFNHF